MEKKTDPRRYPLLTVIHYCQNYGAGNILFSKYLMPDDIFTCSKPLLMEPGHNAMSPDNAYKIAVTGGKQIELEPKPHKHNVFVACAMTRIVNEASLFFKQHSCAGQANKEKTLNLLY